MSHAPAAGKPADTTISTTAQGLDTGSTEIGVGGYPLPLYHAAPAGGHNLPVVLVVQEIFGVHEHIRDVCRRYAHAGYLAVAPDLYSRQGDASAYEDIQKLLRDLVARVPDEQVMADLDACVAWAARHGGDASRLGISGFCWGGRIAWLYTAHQPALKAGVAWYGKLTGPADPLHPRHPLDVAARLHAPVLGLYGAADTGIALDTVAAMQAALAASSGPGRDSAWQVYPDTPHAFFADYRPSYRPEAAHDAWQRSLEWFGKYL